MQKIINVLSLSSFIISGAIAGSGIYVYLQRDSIIEEVVGRALKSAMPELPSLPTGANDLGISVENAAAGGTSIGIPSF